MSSTSTPSPELPQPSRGNGIWPRVLVAAGILAVLVGFYALGLHRYLTWDAIKANLDDWKAQVERHFFLVLVVYFVIYVIVTALSLPTAVLLTLVGGALFGLWLGTAVVSVASTLGATLAFLASRYLFRNAVQRRFGRRLEPLQKGIEREGAYYLFTLRLVPVVPFFLINLGMGLTRMPVLTYALVSWVGMLLGTVLYVNAGTTLANLDSPKDVLSLPVFLSLAALGLAPLVLRTLLRWRSPPGATEPDAGQAVPQAADSADRPPDPPR